MKTILKIKVGENYWEWSDDLDALPRAGEYVDLRPVYEYGDRNGDGCYWSIVQSVSFHPQDKTFSCQLPSLVTDCEADILATEAMLLDCGFQKVEITWNEPEAKTSGAVA